MTRLSANEVSTIRKRLRLSQRQASQIFGGGKDAFFRYESGQATPSLPLSHLLRLIAADTRRLEEMLELATDDSAP